MEISLNLFQEQLIKEKLKHFVLMKCSNLLSQNDSGYILGLAQIGYVATKGWLKSDQAYAAVPGRHFGFIAGDNDEFYRLERTKIVRPTYEQVMELLPYCHPKFLNRVYILINL